MWGRWFMLITCRSTASVLFFCVSVFGFSTHFKPGTWQEEEPQTSIRKSCTRLEQWKKCRRRLIKAHFDIALIGMMTLTLPHPHTEGKFLLNVRNWRCSSGLCIEGLIKDSWNCLSSPSSACWSDCGRLRGWSTHSQDEICWNWDHSLYTSASSPVDESHRV